MIKTIDAGGTIAEYQASSKSKMCPALSIPFAFFNTSPVDVDWLKQPYVLLRSSWHLNNVLSHFFLEGIDKTLTNVSKGLFEKVTTLPVDVDATSLYPFFRIKQQKVYNLMYFLRNFENLAGDPLKRRLQKNYFAGLVRGEAVFASIKRAYIYYMEIMGSLEGYTANAIENNYLESLLKRHNQCVIQISKSVSVMTEDFRNTLLLRLDDFFNNPASLDIRYEWRSYAKLLAAKLKEQVDYSGLAQLEINGINQAYEKYQKGLDYLETIIETQNGQDWRSLEYTAGLIPTTPKLSNNEDDEALRFEAYSDHLRPTGILEEKTTSLEALRSQKLAKQLELKRIALDFETKKAFVGEVLGLKQRLSNLIMQKTNIVLTIEERTAKILEHMAVLQEVDKFIGDCIHIKNNSPQKPILVYIQTTAAIVLDQMIEMRADIQLALLKDEEIKWVERKRDLIRTSTYVPNRPDLIHQICFHMGYWGPIENIPQNSALQKIFWDIIDFRKIEHALSDLSTLPSTEKHKADEIPASFFAYYQDLIPKVMYDPILKKTKFPGLPIFKNLPSYDHILSNKIIQWDDLALGIVKSIAEYIIFRNIQRYELQPPEYKHFELRLTQLKNLIVDFTNSTNYLEKEQMIKPLLNAYQAVREAPIEGLPKAIRDTLNPVISLQWQLIERMAQPIINNQVENELLLFENTYNNLNIANVSLSQRHLGRPLGESTFAENFYKAIDLKAILTEAKKLAISPYLKLFDLDAGLKTEYLEAFGSLVKMIKESDTNAQVLLELEINQYIDLFQELKSLIDANPRLKTIKPQAQTGAPEFRDTVFLRIAVKSKDAFAFINDMKKSEALPYISDKLRSLEILIHDLGPQALIKAKAADNIKDKSHPLSEHYQPKVEKVDYLLLDTEHKVLREHKPIGLLSADKIAKMSIFTQKRIGTNDTYAAESAQGNAISAMITNADL